MPDTDARLASLAVGQVAAYLDWVLECAEHGPPPADELEEVEGDYRYRCRIPDGDGLTVEFIVVVYEQLMIITDF